MQPPSGGCVLKLIILIIRTLIALAAAFGRLCVETLERYPASLDGSAAAFGRLCVETYQP